MTPQKKLNVEITEYLRKGWAGQFDNSRISVSRIKNWYGMRYWAWNNHSKNEQIQDDRNLVLVALGNEGEIMHVFDIPPHTLKGRRSINLRVSGQRHSWIMPYEIHLSETRRDG